MPDLLRVYGLAQLSEDMNPVLFLSEIRHHMESLLLP